MRICTFGSWKDDSSNSCKLASADEWFKDVLLKNEQPKQAMVLANKGSQSSNQPLGRLTLFFLLVQDDDKTDHKV